MRATRRVTVAAILIGVAVLLPTAAWFVSGSRDVARRAASLAAEAESRLRSEIEREADRLGARLENLRAQESERPFFHYQTLYHDPRGAAEGLSVTPSPLTAGTTDPLVRAHFQIDETGAVNLPSVSERFPELTTGADFGALCDLLSELQDAVVLADDQSRAAAAVDDERVLTMTGYEWEQIALADSVYATITGRQNDATEPAPAEAGVGRVAVRVRSLRWQTMLLISGPTLAAVREVHTPVGVVLQGFAVAPEAVSQWLSAGALDLRFSASPIEAADSIMVLVGETGWNVSASASAAREEAALQARELVSDFHRNFAMLGLAVLLAAAAVVWILFQIDSLATQRARFAAAAAHELKTPLSGLLLHSEMLAENLGDPEHRQKYAETVTNEAGRLGRVISNMLDLARLERGGLVAQVSDGDIGRVVRARIDHARTRLEEAGVQIVLEIPPDRTSARFDDDATGQILDNLLDNAEKHTRGMTGRTIRVGLSEAASIFRVEVADNGPGIPRNARRSLFKPFNRPASADGTAGLGLGLALARSLARAQGGDLALDPHHTVGATFVLTVPKSTTA